MTDDSQSERRRDTIAERVDGGEFDAALRPANAEEALREGPERFFALAAEVARAQFDPSDHWDEFVSALWEQVDAGFGLTLSEDDQPAARSWFDHPEDPSFVAWDQREGDR